MCGILGIVSIGDNKSQYFSHFDKAIDSLSHRGPNHRAKIIEKNVALGHTRLSIVDLDKRSHQPMTDISGRWTLIFNGEIYNYKELRKECEEKGFSFVTESDTEVLLVLYIRFGKDCLEKLNGFFAFSIYDRKEKSLFVARDRMGIKPLVYFLDEFTLAVASEMRSLLDLGFPRELDKVSLFTLFKLNYIPAPSTILKKHHKLEPGHYLEAKWDEEDLVIKKDKWYEIPYNATDEKDLNAHDYKHSQSVLKRMVRESVRKRLVADVPVGTFLSGGLDSSIITAIAKEEKSDITAYSIGFESMPYYDETSLARKVSKHLGVDHHVFQVTETDLLKSAEQILDHLDEPFGDSSILNVNVLSQNVSKDVKVALSGDGGDELFAGYHKHGAEFRLRYPRLQEHVAGKLNSVWNALPASRSGKTSNLIRQLRKFSDGYQLGARDRYWRWAGIMTEEEANYLIKEEMLFREQRLSDDAHTYKKRKDHLLRAITKGGTMNEVLLSDMKMVLVNDMLFKVDHASMMHGLEVRTPLLDHQIVKFAFRLPVMFKVNHSIKKKILRDTFEEMLPIDVLNAPKKGFEVPLLEWFYGAMKSRFESAAKDREFIETQNLFNMSAIDELRAKLYSNNPGDAPSIAWTFLVFQTWYKRYMV